MKNLTFFSKNRIYALPSVFSGNFLNSSKSTVDELITGFSLKLKMRIKHCVICYNFILLQTALDN